MIKQKEESLKAKKYTNISLIIFVLLLLAAQIIRQIHLSKQTSYASLINISGKQRMLSQRLGKNIALGKEFEFFEIHYERFKRTHKLLKNGHLTSSSTLRVSLDKMYQDLDIVFSNIQVQIECYKEKKCNSKKNSIELIKQLDLFLTKMDSIVHKKSNFSEDMITNFKTVDFTIFIFVIVTFLMIIINIISPMQKKLLIIINDYILAKDINTKVEQAASIGTWSYDLKKKKMLQSDETFKIYSIDKKDQLTTSSIFEYYKSKDEEILKEYLRDPNLYSKRFDKEFEYTGPNGNKKWLRIIGEPIYNAKGSIIQIAGLLQDITKIKEQEMELKQASDLMQLAIDGADIAIWKWDMISGKSECDQNWYKLYGIKEGEPEKNFENWKDVTHTADIQKTIDEFQNFSKSNKKTFECIHRAKDGRGNWKYILSRGKFSNDLNNGKPSYYIGTCQDITETIKSENEQKFILESLNLGVWKWNMITNELTWDDNLYDLFGYPKDEFPTAYETWMASLANKEQEVKEQLKSELQNSLEEKKDLETYFPIITKDGINKYIGVKATVERTVNGKVISMYGINWDKTNEIEAKKKLEQSLKLANIGEMAAGVGHEINNPLLIIKGYIEMLKSDNLSIDYVNKMLDATKRIEQIVSGLRQFSRKTNDDRANININHMLRTTFDTMVELYSKENISLQLNLESEAVSKGNFGRIQQVLVNLLSNARDAVQNVTDGTITVSLKTIKNFHEITVTDNGVGIPEELQDKVFTPFFSTKDVNVGTGIGLSLAYSIIKEHGGTLSFKSNKNGTSFSFSLPEVLETVDGDKTATATIHTPTNKNFSINTFKSKDIKVICIDDEKDILDILEFYLEELNIKPTLFSNSVEAYEEIKANCYDLIITDLQMPELDGVQLINKVRNNKNIKQPKIIISTGGVNINLEDKSNKLTHMISSYIFKPYNAEELKKAIDNCIP